MDNELNSNYVKRSQKDYSMSFKLQVVGEVKRGELSASAASRKYGTQVDHTVINWIKKYGTFDRELQVKYATKKTAEQRLMDTIAIRMLWLNVLMAYLNRNFYLIGAITIRI